MFHSFFAWYNGSVWPNLVASFLWTIPAYLWGRYHMKKIHTKLKDIHNKVQEGDNNGTTN